jgi:dihydroneopterin triphosphate diphosphatase
VQSAKTSYKVPESVLVFIHTPALEVLLIERADDPGHWQSVNGATPRTKTGRDLRARGVTEETGIAIGAGALRGWG